MMFSLSVDEEIVLKLPTLKNAEELFALVNRNRRYLKKYLYWVDQTKTVNDSKKFIQNNRKFFKESLGFSLCIFYRGQIVGTIGFNYIDRVDRKTELGYWLSKDQQGKGIIHKSCLALIDYSFKTLKLHRIEIRCANHNLPSQRVAQKLGFKKEGILRESCYLNKHFYDTILYSLLITEF